MEKITALEKFNRLMPSEIWRWRDALINEFVPVRGDLVAQYARDCRASGYKKANENLRAITDALSAPVIRYGKIRMKPATMDDEELKEAAAVAAEKAGDIVALSDDMQTMIEKVCDFVGLFDVDWPVTIRKSDTAEKIRDKQLAAVARAQCARWWRRQLRARNGRKVEHVLRTLGRVQKTKQPYVSNWALNRWQKSQHSAKQLLENMEAVNESGEVVSLADAAAASVSNPVNRRNELMVRLRGYEEIAQEMKLQGVFLTLTAPSKYHARHHYGPRNEKYNGSTPAAVQSYLSEVWAHIRARWAKHGIKAFGFRVVEPHHDGTPHWHMLLFFAGGDIEPAWEIFKQEATKADAHEVEEDGSPRVDREDIDPERSATGYIAKYISKNIDAHAVELDEEAGRTGSDGALRARAWASMWGVRQFQQIGAISVTVWRELRRRGDFAAGGIDGLGDVPLFEEIREAADSADWRRFVELMGGPQCKRKEQAIRPQQLPQRKANAYGEEVDRLRGVIMRGAARFIRTRLHEWEVRRKAAQDQAEIVPGDYAVLAPVEKLGVPVVALPSRSEMAHAEWRARKGRRSRATRSTVNNCNH
ncbi:replication endonuclease (plasmid) [Levilactobacillus brevis]|nr:replication endonuclease [Levilactobacillus brevis]